MEESHRNLSESQVYKLLEDGGVFVAPYRIVTSPEGARVAAEELGYPVVCKIISADILHKSKLGGVICNLTNAKEVEQAFNQVRENVTRVQPESRIEGCLISRQMPSAQAEVIVGTASDAEFGRILMFGAGGEFAEFLHCVEFRSYPLSPQDAIQMVRKVQKRMSGIPGWKMMSPEIAADLIQRFNDVLLAHPEIESIDINPAMIYQDHYVVVDAKGMEGSNQRESV